MELDKDRDRATLNVTQTHSATKSYRQRGTERYREARINTMTETDPAK
jgi:hypothetical protein